MELGSYPDLESIPDDLASISDFVGSALKGASAPASSRQQEDPSCSSVESNQALRRLLLKQMPSVEVRFWLFRLAAFAAIAPYAEPYRWSSASALLHLWCSLLACPFVTSITASSIAPGHTLKAQSSSAKRQSQASPAPDTGLMSGDAAAGGWKRGAGGSAADSGVPRGQLQRGAGELHAQQQQHEVSQEPQAAGG